MAASGQSIKENEEVNQGLDRFGWSKKQFELSYLDIDLREILDNSYTNDPDKYRVFSLGSSGESSSYGLNADAIPVPSDSDIMVCELEKLVICEKDDLPRANRALEVYEWDGQGMHDGYGMLRKLNSKNGYTSSGVAADAFYREYKMHMAFFGPERQGPAVSLNVSGNRKDTSMDYVLAYPFASWPHCVRKWFRRTRRFGWPKTADIATILKDGCHVVPVGHKNSIVPRQRYQWRISTVVAERTLIRSFNDTQHRTYFILKYIKSLIAAEIDERFENQNVLCSYHMKTVMFWMVHETPPELWQRGSLVRCVKECLARLQSFVDEGYLPVYFVPENNLLDTATDVQLKLLSYAIKSYRVNISLVLMMISSLKERKDGTGNLQFRLCGIQCLPYLKPDDIQMEDPLTMAVSFKRIKKICLSTKNKTVGRLVFRLIQMFCFQSLGCMCQELAMLQGNDSYFRQAEIFLLSAVNLDKVGSRLKVANLYYSRGKSAKAVGKLEEAAMYFEKAKKYIQFALDHENMKFHITACICDKTATLDSYPQELTNLLENESGITDHADLLCWAMKTNSFGWDLYFPVKFSHLSCLPEAVQYVLYAGNPGGSPALDCLTGRLTLLPLYSPIFGLFLGVICAHESGEEAEVAAYLQKLEDLCERIYHKDCHRGIGYSLLGQCHMMLGNQLEACSCFVRSYQAWPSLENSALWLLGIMCIKDIP
ncbi:uncharacterized protein LOC106177725 [Lingula anatina]|uniref:Uncharacterized protein LOC106177725 n=1 Tax=Lingula anatina TaxID=7574 RepID=A0A1S3K065_LINAN|nr:uncharacterized protein LOC106177725 [Lingula anatina]|eukprot:XP_013416040.1 uncharacterized protein LOC106177725 [Lingula anatina]